MPLSLSRRVPNFELMSLIYLRQACDTSMSCGVVSNYPLIVWLASKSRVSSMSYNISLCCFVLFLRPIYARLQESCLLLDFVLSYLLTHPFKWPWSMSNWRLVKAGPSTHELQIHFASFPKLYGSIVKVGIVSKLGKLTASFGAACNCMIPYSWLGPGLIATWAPVPA